MTAALYKHSPEVAHQHVANMTNTLDHRISVARSNNDYRLLRMLLDEKSQLDSLSGQWSNSSAGLLGKVHILWKKVLLAVKDSNQLTVEKIVDNSGEVWWYAHDPRTDKTLWAETEAEIINWIEDNNLGN